MAEKDNLPFPEIIGEGVTLFKEAVTKAKIKEFSKAAVAKINYGHGYPLDKYVAAKIGIEYFSILAKTLAPSAMEEAAKYDKDVEAKMYGCAFNISSVAQKFTYNHDDVWLSLKHRADEIKEEIKAREDLMKKARDFSGVVDEDGVEIPPAELVGGTSSSSLRVTIPTK